MAAPTKRETRSGLCGHFSMDYVPLSTPYRNENTRVGAAKFNISVRAFVFDNSKRRPLQVVSIPSIISQACFAVDSVSSWVVSSDISVRGAVFMILDELHG